MKMSFFYFYAGCFDQNIILFCTKDRCHSGNIATPRLFFKYKNNLHFEMKTQSQIFFASCIYGFYGLCFFLQRNGGKLFAVGTGASLVFFI